MICFPWGLVVIPCDLRFDHDIKGTTLYAWPAMAVSSQPAVAATAPAIRAMPLVRSFSISKAAPSARSTPHTIHAADVTTNTRCRSALRRLCLIWVTRDLKCAPRPVASMAAPGSESQAIENPRPSARTREPTEKPYIATVPAICLPGTCARKNMGQSF